MNFWQWCTAHKVELIIAAVVVVVLILIICIAVGIHNRKKKSAVGNIYKTTDGFLGNKPQIKKSRSVAATEQRKMDGAVAVVKISSKEGREEKIGKDFIPDLELLPEDHEALTKVSIVSRHVIFGIKEGKTFKPIYISDLTNTGDKLTRKELRKIRKEVHNYLEKHRETYKKKKRKWYKGFKK